MQIYTFSISQFFPSVNILYDSKKSNKIDQKNTVGKEKPALGGKVRNVIISGKI